MRKNSKEGLPGKVEQSKVRQSKKVLCKPKISLSDSLPGFRSTASYVQYASPHSLMYDFEVSRMFKSYALLFNITSANAHIA